MTFAKKLLLGSVIAMGAFGLVACGDDSSSDNNPAQAAVNPALDPASQQKDDIIKLNNPKASYGIDEVKFGGTFEFDKTNTSMTLEEMEDLQFTGIQVSLYYNNAVVPNAEIHYNANIFPAAKIYLESIASLGVSIDLTQAALVEAGCGVYTLFMEVQAVDGLQRTYKYQETINFERNASSYCKDLTPSSSSQVPDQNGIFMTSCTVNLSTNMLPAINLDNPCMAIDAGNSATADIIFTKTGNTKNSNVSVSSGSGVKFGETNDDYDTSNWPEDVNERQFAYTSDFKARLVNSSTISNFIGDSDESKENIIFVAQSSDYNAATGNGFYAFGVVPGSKKKVNNGDYEFTLKVYQVQ